MHATRTYLEMLAPPDPSAVVPLPAAARLERLERCPASFYRYLYAEVGRPWRWLERVSWTDEAIAAHVGRPDIALWLLVFSGAPAGFFELRRVDVDRSIEIAYFGLLPDMIGRGLGRAFLSCAVREAWALSPARVWLNTCTFDHPAAIPNYLARGFRIYREEAYEVGD